VMRWDALRGSKVPKRNETSEQLNAHLSTDQLSANYKRRHSANSQYMSIKHDRWVRIQTINANYTYALTDRLQYFLVFSQFLFDTDCGRNHMLSSSKPINPSVLFRAKNEINMAHYHTYTRSATALELIIGRRNEMFRVFEALRERNDFLVVSPCLFNRFRLELSKLSAEPLLRFSNSKKADPGFLQLCPHLRLLSSAFLQLL